MNLLEALPLEPGALYVLDRAFVDFTRLSALTQAGVFFVVRAKDNFRCRRLYSHPIDRTTGLRSDHTVRLVGYYVARAYPASLRRVRYYDLEHDRYLTFLTNAVETQVWIALSVYVLVALVKRRLALPQPLATILQILDVALFEKTDLLTLVRQAESGNLDPHDPNQLSLIDL